MNDPKKSARPEEETVHLNLGAFAPNPPPRPPATAPGPAAAQPAAPAPDEGEVTVLISRATREVTGSSVGAAAAEGGAPAPSEGSPKELVGAVAYAYAKGVYRSEDIAAKMAANPEFNAATHGETPDARTLRRVRVQNRGPILEILARFFRDRTRKAASGGTNPPPAVAPSALPTPQAGPGPTVEDHPGEATLLARRDAERHLDKAAFIDNMSKED